MQPRAVEQDVVDMERKYWQAMKTKDVDAAIAMTDDPCIVTGAQGIGRIDHRAFEQLMRAAHWTLHEFELGNVQARLLSDDVAVVAYQVTERLTVEGQPVTVKAADSSTWVRREGRWLCALHTEAIAGDAFGRDRRGPATR